MSPPTHVIDTLMPIDVARKAESIGVQKVRMDTMSLFALAVLAGAFIAFGAMFATTVLAGADGAVPFGIAKLLSGLAFCLGLILVVVSGAELFTGNTLMVIAHAAGEVRFAEMLRAWAIVYVGNFVGAVGTAAMVFVSGQYLLGKGSVALVAMTVAVSKVSLPFGRALVLGILCNVLVCLAVWLTYGARTTTDKILAIVFPVSAFVAAGFEHSVANMYFIPLALFIKTWAPATLWAQIGGMIPDRSVLTWSSFFLNLLPVTIGNLIGGGGFVGGIYWFIYLRKRPA